MAYLNVRERRIEAKIAYVGPELSGKATNLEVLERSGRDAKIERLGASDAETGELLALAWQPADRSRFRDCDVLVNLVAQKGQSTDRRIEALVRDADGVVVVVDAHPSSIDKNRASLDAVREALARGARRDVTLVVQINKTDLPDALSPADVVGAIDASSVDHVAAVAARGEGVLETLEAALEGIMSSMQSEQRGPETMRPASTTTPTLGEGGHPLLAALRQVLRSTVDEHAAGLEKRVTEHVETAFAQVEAGNRAIGTAFTQIAERNRTLEGALGKLTAELTAMSARVEALSTDRADAMAAMQLVELAETIDRRVGELYTRVDRVRDELKNEMVRIGETRSRADREHLASATGTLKKAVEAIGSELRGTDARVDANAGGLAALAARIDQIEAAQRQRSTRLEEIVREGRHEAAAAASAADAKTAGVQARVDEILEEMKKPKKGWFA